jgi:hypothetical protein
MSKILADLLDQPEIAVHSAINKLETLSGFHGNDIKVLSEVSNKVRTTIKSLGLDPDDTAGSELYRALLARFEHDEQLLAQSLGVKKGLTPEKFGRQIALFIDHLDMPKNVWALKRSTAKNLLKKQPPKDLMKQLNYRSVDSLLKREDIAALYGALAVTESGRWQKEFWRSFTKLTAADFENRKAEIIVLSGKRWQAVHGGSPMISNVEALGTVIVVPDEALNRLGTIGLSLFLAHHINNLRISSAYIKLHQIESNFGNALTKVCREGIVAPAELSHLPIAWKTIFHHYGKASLDDFQAAFEPHIVQEDVSLESELKALAKLNPVFRWWSGHEHTAANINGHHVSLNIMDIIASYAAGHSYEQRSTAHFRQSLWNNLIDKYLEYDGVKRFIMPQLGVMEPAFEPAVEGESNRFLNTEKYAGAL